jgi:hypothetical protein
MNPLTKWLNKSTKPTTKENSYTPPMGVNDANRKQFFTTYNVELVNELRRIKLNQVNK